MARYVFCPWAYPERKTRGVIDVVDLIQKRTDQWSSEREKKGKQEYTFVFWMENQGNWVIDGAPQEGKIALHRADQVYIKGHHGRGVGFISDMTQKEDDHIGELNRDIEKDNRRVRRENRLVKEENKVIRETNKVIREENKVIRETNKIIRETNKFTKEKDVPAKPKKLTPVTPVTPLTPLVPTVRQLDPAELVRRFHHCFHRSKAFTGKIKFFNCSSGVNGGISFAKPTAGLMRAFWPNATYIGYEDDLQQQYGDYHPHGSVKDTDPTGSSEEPERRKLGMTTGKRAKDLQIKLPPPDSLDALRLAADGLNGIRF
jgi:hypothetical protein